MLVLPASYLRSRIGLFVIDVVLVIGGEAVDTDGL
jgi:hypothetical protein